MKKLVGVLIFFGLLLCQFHPAFAEEDEAQNRSILQRFPAPVYINRFHQVTKREYYRFPAFVPFFDPLDLNYFPHEKWRQTDWSLLSRWEDSRTYHQLIMQDEPAENWVFHGTSIGKDYGFPSDFYLYATLFVTDSFPEDSGSCYVYYSNSFMKGLSESAGILVDPGSGIYQVNNTYSIPYNLTNKSHELNLLKLFSPADYPVSEDNVEGSSFAAADFAYARMDEHFASDWKSVRDSFHIPGTGIKAYRLELLREGTTLSVYINGILAAEVNDGITAEGADGEIVPDRVSWSYGPILYTGGETVTCSIGDLYIYSRGREGRSE